METQLDNVGTIPGTKLLLSKCYPSHIAGQN